MKMSSIEKILLVYTKQIKKREMQTRNRLLKHAFPLFFSLFSFDDKLGEFYNSCKL